MSSVRGSRYWYEFEYAGVRHRRSSRTGSPRAAREMECAHRSALIRSAAGLPAAVPRATVAELAARFVAFLPSSGLRPGSQRFYAAGLRLRAAAVLALDAGLRPGESVSLTRRDVRAGDPPHIVLGVQPGRKGRRPRKVPLTPRAAEALASLRGEPLLGFRLTTSLDHAHAVLRRRLGLPPEFTPHSFRHTCATRMGAAGVDPYTMCRFFGWASIEMAMRYVHPSDASMRAALLALGPHKSTPSGDDAIAEWAVSH